MVSKGVMKPAAICKVDYEGKALAGTRKRSSETLLHLAVNASGPHANHGTVTFGPDLEKAYWNSEIIDAYCRILILSKQLGNVNYFNEGQTKELLALKRKLGYDDIRFHENCDLCANSDFGRGFMEE